MAKKRIVYGNSFSVQEGLYSSKPVKCKWDAFCYWDIDPDGLLSVPDDVNDKIQAQVDDLEKGTIIAYSTNKEYVAAWTEGVKSVQQLMNLTFMRNLDDE
jgi:hypothetical protein